MSFVKGRKGLCAGPMLGAAFALAVVFFSLAVAPTAWAAESDGVGAAQSHLNAGTSNLAPQSSGGVSSYAYYYDYAYRVVFHKNPPKVKGGKKQKDATRDQFIYVNDTTKLANNKFKCKGYAFAGWNTKKNGKGKAYKDAQEVENLAKGGRTTNLYAQWKPAYYVKFLANKGTGKMSRQALPYGVASSLKANKFKRTGYVFVGWNTKKNGKGKSYADKQTVKKLKKAGKTVKLYAQWTNKCTVTFNANGATGNMGKQKLKVGAKKKLAAVKYTRKGYFFKGWNTDKDGNGTAYTDKQVVTGPLAGGINTVLYAQWGECATEVTFSNYEDHDELNDDPNCTFLRASTQSLDESDKGKVTARLIFKYNGDPDAYKQLSVTVKDVTPPAYRKMFKGMGIATEKPKVVGMQRYVPDAYEAYYGGTYTEGQWATVDVLCGQSTLVANAFITVNGKQVESGYFSNGESYTDDLYWGVIHKVEKKLWTDSMTNGEKLYALAGYINSVTHYPYSDSMRSSINPEFWDNWSIEGKSLYWSWSNTAMNWLMRFQGGVADCWSVKQLGQIAQEDLGLKWLYDSEKDEIAAGEGIWTAYGEYSSMGMPGSHMSLIYKDANEQKYYIDAEGSHYGSCSQHKCQQYVISLS